MIGTLLREQLRAQRAALVWMTALIAAAAGFATYASSANVTDDALARQAAVLSGTGQYWGQAAVVADHGDDVVASDWGTPMTRDEIATFIADANAEGAGLVATEPASDSWIAHQGAGPEDHWYANSQAFAGEVPWDVGLAEGRAPGAGEVAIPANVAAAWGVGMGDRIEVGYSTWDHDGPGVQVSLGTRMISAIVVDAVTWDAARLSDAPTVLAAGDPVFTASSEAPSVYPWDDGSFAQVQFTWTIQTPTTTAAFPSPGTTMVSGGTQAGTATLLAAVLALGTVVAAVAVGRSQAQRRARWTATARALGASRSSIAAATLAEGAIVGLVGGAIGLSVGRAVAQWHLSGALSAVAAPPDVALAVTAATVATALGGGLALGLVITAIPAVLAARVTPASALKDVAAVDEAELTRHVRIWPVGVIAALGYVAILVTASWFWDSGSGYWWFLLECAVTLICAFALAVEGSRRAAARMGRWLSRRRSPAAVRAGLDLTAHPRQAAALMLLHTLAVAAIVAVASLDQITDPFTNSADFGWYAYAPISGSVWSGPQGLAAGWAYSVNVSLPITLSVLLVVQALVAAIVVGSRGLATGEEAAARALGLDARGARWAEVLRHAVPQLAGAVLGGVLAFLLAVPFAAAAAPTIYAVSGGPAPASLANAAVVAAVLTTFAVIVIVVGAAVAWGVRSIPRARERVRE